MQKYIQETGPTVLPESKTMTDVMPKTMPAAGSPDMSDVMPEQMPM